MTATRYYLIASDLPWQGASSPAVCCRFKPPFRQELKNRQRKACDYNIGFQACDDATAQAAQVGLRAASQNANAYAANDKLVGAGR